MKMKTLNVPVELCSLVLKNKDVNTLKVYLGMRALYVTHVNKKDVDYKAVAEVCGFASTKSVRNHIKGCLKKNWIGENKTTYFLHGIKDIKRLCNITSRSTRKIDLTTELKDLNTVLFAIDVAHLIKRRKKCKGSNTRGQKCLHRYELGEGEKFTANTLSLRFLAKRLNVSHTTIHKWKMKAIKLGYIVREKCSHFVDKVEHAVLFMNEETYNRLYTYRHKVFLRLTDEIYSDMRFKSV